MKRLHPGTAKSQSNPLSVALIGGGLILACLILYLAALVSARGGIGYLVALTTEKRGQPNEEVRKDATSFPPNRLAVAEMWGLYGYDGQKVVVRDSRLLRELLTTLQDATLSGGESLSADASPLVLLDANQKKLMSVKLYRGWPSRDIGTNFNRLLSEIAREQASQLAHVVRQGGPIQAIVLPDGHKIRDPAVVAELSQFLQSGSPSLYAFRAPLTAVLRMNLIPNKGNVTSISISLSTDNRGKLLPTQLSPRSQNILGKR